MSNVDVDSMHANWKKLISEIQGSKTRGALTEIGIAVQGYALLDIPVDTGNLANSQYLNVTPIPDGHRLEVGYTANYAFFVHETSGSLRGTNTPRTGRGSTGDYWDGYGGDQGQPKYLDIAVDEMRQNDFDRIIQEYYE